MQPGKLRGLAAIAVFFGHSDASGLATTAWLAENRSVLGKFSVYLFFGISGLLIRRGCEISFVNTTWSHDPAAMSL